MAGKTVVNTVQLGDSGTATQNFVLKTNANGTLTLARGNDGATTQDILTIDANGNVNLPNNTFESTEQTITVAGALTIGHGLGTTPKFFTGYLINKTSDGGYSIGDKAIINLQTYSDAGHYGIQLTDFNATNVTFRFGSSGLQIANKTSGVNTIITPANWRFVIIART